MINSGQDNKKLDSTRPLRKGLKTHKTRSGIKIHAADGKYPNKVIAK